ncbi:MAG: hypothetical protein R8G66_06450 [Cytophagales bacterium]|nr:hypothetical protein [Cytophagales bacterium]
MKNYLIVLCMSLLSFLSACKEDPIEWNVRRLIINESPVDLKIDVYLGDSVFETISIAQNNLDEKMELCRRSNGDTNCNVMSNVDLRWNQFADSVVITFANDRSLTYCQLEGVCSEGLRNIMNLTILLNNEGDFSESGYVRSDIESVQTYTYTITEEDYQNAEQISG